MPLRVEHIGMNVQRIMRDRQEQRTKNHRVESEISDRAITRCGKELVWQVEETRETSTGKQYTIYHGINFTPRRGATPNDCRNCWR